MHHHQPLPGGLWLVPIHPRTMQLFRSLPPDEEASFRQWARDNYQPFATINGTWHPVIQDECRRINEQVDFDPALA